MEENGNSWLPPLEFYFSVEFQWGSRHAKASFMEVGGLSVTLETAPLQSQGGDEPRFPQRTKSGDVVLKRALEPLSEEISTWVQKCMGFSESGWIEPCLLTIRLLNVKEKITAAWTCSMAYPVKCEVSSFNAGESKLVIETLTLTCSRTKRVV